MNVKNTLNSAANRNMVQQVQAARSPAAEKTTVRRKRSRDLMHELSLLWQPGSTTGNAAKAKNREAAVSDETNFSKLPAGTSEPLKAEQAAQRMSRQEKIDEYLDRLHARCDGIISACGSVDLRDRYDPIEIYKIYGEIYTTLVEEIELMDNIDYHPVLDVQARASAFNEIFRNWRKTGHLDKSGLAI